MNFLKTDEAQQIIWLDYFGYPLAKTQQELTPLQALFLTKGRMELEKELRKAEEEKVSNFIP